jgi:lysophospholipase L1-like esterase
MFFATRRHSPIRRIAAAALLVIDMTGCDRLGLSNKNPAAPTGPPAPGSSIVYTAIGASDAIGHGGSVECVPFTDCPAGTGYVQVTARTLKALGFSVTLNNLGIPTAVIGRDFEILGQQYHRTIVGNFIDQEMPFVLKNSTVVTIFAGGNEVNTITAALGGGAGAGSRDEYIDAQVKAFGADFGVLLKGIRDRASARIIILNLPNLAGLPYLATAPISQRQAAQRAAAGMTAVVDGLASGEIAVIDLMCDARSYQASNYSSDGFHPNDSGYAFLAAEVVKAITSASYPAPNSRCAPMAIVP